MQCHAVNNGVFNNFIKSATAAFVISAPLIITNLNAPVLFKVSFILSRSLPLMIHFFTVAGSCAGREPG